ncbi:MAG TPA: NAD kinase [Bacteroidales bacterium]|nr:NAD kinase [Bacteroidales bacterium]HRW97733.1 NAD kinase [Bacteroidales bacterium]
MPKKIALFGKSIDEQGVTYLQQLLNKLDLLQCSLLVYEPFYEKIRAKVFFQCPLNVFNTHAELRNNADILFSIGGDGTLLDTISLVRDSDIPILGVNLGRLGFLSSISKDEILSAIDYVIEGNYTLDRRTLLSLYTNNNLFGDLNFALNEFSITKSNPHALAVINVYVDDVFLNTYWADGLLIATPTGSTAYSLSCFGPIITPDSENFVITPIASHNLTVRPIVIPDKSTIRISIEGRNDQYQAGLDSRFKNIDHNTIMTVRRAGFNINLIQLPKKDFFITIREKLFWGKDQRN